MKGRQSPRRGISGGRSAIAGRGRSASQRCPAPSRQTQSAPGCAPAQPRATAPTDDSGPPPCQCRAAARRRFDRPSSPRGMGMGTPRLRWRRLPALDGRRRGAAPRAERHDHRLFDSDDRVGRPLLERSACDEDTCSRREKDQRSHQTAPPRFTEALGKGHVHGSCKASAAASGDPSARPFRHARSPTPSRARGCFTGYIKWADEAPHPCVSRCPMTNGSRHRRITSRAISGEPRRPSNTRHRRRRAESKSIQFQREQHSCLPFQKDESAVPG